MPFPPAETISDTKFSKALDVFYFLVDKMPHQVPYKGLDDTAFVEFLVRPFQLDEKYMGQTEDECSTISEQLKHAFSWNAHIVADGIIAKLEHGPGLLGVHEIISQYHRKHPS